MKQRLVMLALAAGCIVLAAVSYTHLAGTFEKIKGVSQDPGNTGDHGYGQGCGIR